MIFLYRTFNRKVNPAAQKLQELTFQHAYNMPTYQNLPLVMLGVDNVQHSFLGRV